MLESQGYPTEIFEDPIHFTYTNMDEIGEALETLIKEYVLRPEDIPLFDKKLSGNLPDSAIYMDETSGMTHAEFADRFDA